MKDNKVNNNSTWQNLNWEKKVQICQQAIAIGDTLLLTLVVMLVAFEAMLFTILVTQGWGQWWSIILAILGMGYPFFHSYFFEKRGDQVDYWGEKLHHLLNEVNQSEAAKHWKGCVERRSKRQGKCGRWKVIFGWGHPFNIGRFKSTRRLFTTFIPLLLVGVWILMVCHYC